MELSEFAQFFDHTKLNATASEAEITQLCAEAKEFGFATVCVNPYWIPLCSKLLKDSSALPITVVGFPLGANLSSSKATEAKEAIAAGAKEIDMVINIAALKDGKMDAVKEDINCVLKACATTPLKVILETCYLSEEEIRSVSKTCSDLGVAFVKTSTGFGSRGASLRDIEIMKESISPEIKIKASGGIRSLEDAEKMIAAGAQRIGASASVAIIKEWKEKYAVS